ncbi:MAG: carboxymuconolactone decarboxylase family protein, partial [Hyphomicrobiaceae bacterium]
ANDGATPMTRLPVLDPERLTLEQKRVYDTIAGDKRRQATRRFRMMNDDGSLTGPFNALLYSPAVGDAVQQLGGALRFDSSLPGHLRELAILMVAQRWRADYEWYAHAPIAANEELGEAVIAAIKAGKTLENVADDVQAAHRFVHELMQARRVCDETYAETCAIIGEQGLVELISVIGYYTLLAGLLNTFEVGVPEGEEPPFGS